MSTSTANKQELVNWIKELEDQSILEIIQSIKNSQSESDWWEELPKSAKKGIERGEADVQAGRIHHSEDFWKKIKRRRKERG